MKVIMTSLLIITEVFAGLMPYAVFATIFYVVVFSGDKAINTFTPFADSDTSKIGNNEVKLIRQSGKEEVTIVVDAVPSTKLGIIYRGFNSSQSFTRVVNPGDFQTSEFYTGKFIYLVPPVKNAPYEIKSIGYEVSKQ